jgi:acyl-CoA reductase-like NAD-dependent aldehyde dehydrogenase
MDMFIDGGWRQAVAGTRHNVVNPATGAVVDTVPTGGKRDADIAIFGRRARFPGVAQNADRDTCALAEKGRKPDA